MNQQKIDTQFKRMNGVSDEDFEAYKDLFRTTSEYGKIQLRMSLQGVGETFKQTMKGNRK